MNHLPRSRAYAQLWNIIDGAVADAFNNHDDYFTPKGKRSARTSVVKRVTGTVLGFAEQSARGRGNPAETAPAPARVSEPAIAGATAIAEGGALFRHPHCRPGRIIRVKTKPGWTRDAKRKAAAYIRTHAELMAARYSAGAR